MTAKQRKIEPKPEPKPSEQLTAEVAEMIGEVDLSTAPKINYARALTPSNKMRVLRLGEQYQQMDALSADDEADFVEAVENLLRRCAVDRVEFETWLTSDGAFEQMIPMFVHLVEQLGELTRSSS